MVPTGGLWGYCLVLARFFAWNSLRSVKTHDRSTDAMFLNAQRHGLHLLTRQKKVSITSITR